MYPKKGNKRIGGWGTLLQTIELSGGPEAVAAARHAIERVAEEQQLSRRDDLRLLVSELVTNSILHGGAARPDDQVLVHICFPDDSIRVEVCDTGESWGEPLRSPSLEALEPAGGWGLMLVGALADRWGVEGDDGTCVWFELARSQA